MTESGSGIAWSQGWEDDCIQRGKKKLLGVMEKFYMLIVVMIIQVYTLVETYQITTQNEHVLLLCKLYFNKINFKMYLSSEHKWTGLILPPFIYLITLLP